MPRKSYLNLPPYRIPGRWYRTFVESDGIDVKITSSDIEGVTFDESANAVNIPKRAMHAIIDMHFTESDSIVPTYGYNTDHTVIYLNDPANYDYAYIYIFVCED